MRTEETTQDIDDTATGAFIVTTASRSEYLVDLTTRTLTRLLQPTDSDLIPAGENGDFGAYETSTDYDRYRLRGDGNVLPLVKVLYCVVGDRAVFAITGAADAETVTLRQTTAVTKITSVSIP